MSISNQYNVLDLKKVFPDDYVISFTILILILHSITKVLSSSPCTGELYNYWVNFSNILEPKRLP